MAGTDASSRSKSTHLDLPTPTPTSAGARPRPTTTASHLLPATALFHGPNSRNASHTSLPRSHRDRDDHTTNTPSVTTPADSKLPPQHLPRAHPPTTSFSSPRPSLITNPQSAGPTANATPHSAPHKSFATISKKEDDFRADAVWAEMQKTLADVELSAMNSSHVFSSAHAAALEDLRSAQLGLAMAWAKSEADEGVDEEFGAGEMGFGVGGIGNVSVGSKEGTPGAGAAGHARQASTGSNGSGGSRGETLEQETERDILLAKRRREANDRYFRQVNRGVLDIVGKLDDVVGAMRRVEKESREIWNDGSESEDLGVVTETDEDVGASKGGRRRGETLESRTTVGTESEVLTDSPVGTR